MKGKCAFHSKHPPDSFIDLRPICRVGFDKLGRSSIKDAISKWSYRNGEVDKRTIRVNFLRPEWRVHDHGITKAKDFRKCLILYVSNNEFYLCIKQFSIFMCYIDRIFININPFHRCRPQKGCANCEHTSATTEIAYNFSLNISFHECMIQ